jgi:hypothetical protein
LANPIETGVTGGAGFAGAGGAVDRDWREVVNEREVQYSNLAPGNYRFRVTACNNSGVWNDTGTFLDFSIDPAYYQTNWFRVLCAAALLALLWGIHQLRIEQLRYQERKLRDVIETMPTSPGAHIASLPTFGSKPCTSAKSSTSTPDGFSLPGTIRPLCIR